MKAKQPKPLLPRRHYSDDLKRQAVQMLLDGHSAVSIAANLGLSNRNLLYRWKALFHPDPTTPIEQTEERIRLLQEQLRRSEQGCSRV